MSFPRSCFYFMIHFGLPGAVLSLDVAAVRPDSCVGLQGSWMHCWDRPRARRVLAACPLLAQWLQWGWWVGTVACLHAECFPEGVFWRICFRHTLCPSHGIWPELIPLPIHSMHLTLKKKICSWMPYHSSSGAGAAAPPGPGLFNPPHPRAETAHWKSGTLQPALLESALWYL